MKKRKCKNKHCSSKSNSEWCGSNSKADILKLHDIGPNAKCKCQKQSIFTPGKFELEVGGYKIYYREILKAPKQLPTSLSNRGFK